MSFCFGRVPLEYKSDVKKSHSGNTLTLDLTLESNGSLYAGKNQNKCIGCRL